MGKMPFEVSRQSRTTLIDQVVEGLRSAIGMGHYRSGEMLPNLQEMAGALGVSEIVIRRAIGRLAREGLVNPRRRVGIAVCGNGMKVWRGHVLYITWGSAGMYYKSVFGGALSACLHEANVLVSTVHVSGVEAANGFPKIRAELGHAVSLAVIEGVSEGLDNLLAARNIPFIHLHPADSAPSSGAQRSILARRMNVLADVCRHCVECGIRRVLEVVQDVGGGEVFDRLSAAGMTVETLRAEATPGLDSPEAVERGAMESMRRWLAAKPVLPDLIWFGDDFVARGALLALTGTGIRVPDDVQVISWANRGMGPVFLKPLTRVEMDPKAHGEIVARCILEQMEGKPTPTAALELSPVFIKGETTRTRV